MASIVRYGADSSVRLEFSDEVLLAECGTSPGLPLDDPAASASQALADPIDYPSLSKSTTPGDHVVVALGDGVPRAGEIVAAVVRALVQGGVHPDGITVLRSTEDTQTGIGDPRNWLATDLKDRISLRTHHREDRGSIAYLAALEGGEPILLNRAITDADVVIPVGCVRGRQMAGYHGVHSPVFPTFSDRRTLARFWLSESESISRTGRGSRKLNEEVDHVGWLLGVTFTVQAVPGPSDGILHILAGEAHAVADVGARLYEAAWRCSVPRRASLVVAAIEGGPAQQTWRNLGRALASANSLVEDGGAIAVCCEVASEPGPALKRLGTANDCHYLLKEISRLEPEDALPASQLALVSQRAKVYLLSRLERVAVEELEIAHIAGTDELVRLTQRHKSCIVLANAAYAMTG